MTDDIDTSDSTPEPRPRQQAPATPEGHLTLSEAEHNKLQADLRRLRKELEQREKAEADALRKREQQEAEARGEYDKALERERRDREKAERELQELRRAESLREEIAIAGYSGEQAAALLRLAGPDATDASTAAAAVEATIKRFPGLFQTRAAATPPQPRDEQAPRQQPVRPTTPASLPTGAEKVDGYISQEEYLRTPRSERMTSEFQARVARSEPFWPSEVPAGSFAQDG